MLKPPPMAAIRTTNGFPLLNVPHKAQKQPSIKPHPSTINNIRPVNPGPSMLQVVEGWGFLTTELR